MRADLASWSGSSLVTFSVPWRERRGVVLQAAVLREHRHNGPRLAQSAMMSAVLCMTCLSVHTQLGRGRFPGPVAKLSYLRAFAGLKISIVREAGYRARPHIPPNIGLMPRARAPQRAGRHPDIEDDAGGEGPEGAREEDGHHVGGHQQRRRPEDRQGARAAQDVRPSPGTVPRIVGWRLAPSVSGRRIAVSSRRHGRAVRIRWERIGWVCPRGYLKGIRVGCR